MKTCFYRYIVTYWDDFDECNKTSSGFVEGAKYSDVVDKLASFLEKRTLFQSNLSIQPPLTAESSKMKQSRVYIIPAVKRRISNEITI